MYFWLGEILFFGIIGLWCVLFPRRAIMCDRWIYRKLHLISEERRRRPVKRWALAAEFLIGLFLLALAASVGIHFRIAVDAGDAVPISAADSADAATKATVDAIAGPFVAAGKTVGMVVGVIHNGERHVYGYGRKSICAPGPPDGDTVYEIGSITKTFTALLLADMAQAGLVTLDDPVAKHLPDSVHVPEYLGQPITLVELASQVSGLPRMPSNFFAVSRTLRLWAKPFANPYANYNTEDMYAFLSNHTLRRAPGDTYEYSNLGFGVLGNALARRAGMDYESLVASRICGPLGMHDTRATLDTAMRARLATPHAGVGRVGPFRIAFTAANWDIEGLAGCGALRSTASDMLLYLAANLGETQSPLKDAMETTYIKRHVVSNSMDIGMGWHIRHHEKDPEPIFWHNGGTGGYRTFAGFVKNARTAVIVLSNSTQFVDNPGMEVLMKVAWPGRS
jgi:CubicO group peptidase (beta-lactamase class C family)